MDRPPYGFYDRPRPPSFAMADLSAQAILVYVFAALFFVHQILHQYNIVSLSIPDALWNSFVALTPSPILLDATQRSDLGPSATWSQVHAAKAESMRKMLGLRGRGLLQQISAPTTLLKRMSVSSSPSPTATSIRSNAPPGLGNWDNSCYQNSVLQGLTSLGSLQIYLDRWTNDAGPQSTMRALQETTDKLRDPYNNGKHTWTPAKLKSMSSWQQQDAQEYFSKIMDELDKDVAKAGRTAQHHKGCESVTEQGVDDTFSNLLPANPLEGMVAQQVVCTSCGFSEGLSMIPFNCLTLPLDSKPEVALEECLSEYTKLESIAGVECARCTLLKTRKELHRLVPEETAPSVDGATQTGTAPSQQSNQLKSVLQLPPELRAQVMQRLSAVQKALDSDDFSDETLSQACGITKNVRVSSTKTRQALLARMPANLVIHINRSVFDEMTGMLRKNYAALRYPALLKLDPWIVGAANDTSMSTLAEQDTASLPRQDMWKYIYRIKAIVTHYGRHENGHYIAYRQAPVYSDDELQDGVANSSLDGQRKQQWWQLSDETVLSMSEAEVLDQGGVFMLFYERIEEPTRPLGPATVQAAGSEVALNHTTSLDREPRQIAVTIDRPSKFIPADHDVPASDASVTEDESEADIDEAAAADVPRTSSVHSPLLMRTANVERPNDEHWNVGRFMAAT